MTVVATAGHVDHGKSTLVRYLTGTDPDRLAEEKERGMTIDLGFGSATLSSGRELGFVDVPGHERYLKNMLAGVTSVDACLFVVDTTEGWRAQSEEHLRILELLGVKNGVVALTKVGLVDRESAEIVELEVADRLAGTFLQDADVVFVDAPSGLGMEELNAAIDRMIAVLAETPDNMRPRLWVDRSFAIHGAGTVLTGTLTGGRISVDDDVVVEPGRRAVRVRGLQSHHGALSSAGPGRRLAVNVVGADHRLVRRGDALVRSGQWHVTSCFDASIRVLEGADVSVGSHGAYRVHLGSGSATTRLRVLGKGTSVQPGEQGMVRLWLQHRSLPLLPGDRYVLREMGRATTVGGGEVLDVEPVLPASRATPSRSVERIVAERGWVDAAELERLTGVRSEPTVGRWVMTLETRDEIESSLIARASGSGRDGIRLASLSDVERATLSAGVDALLVERDRVYRSDMIGTGLSRPATEVLAMLENDPWSPPDIPLAQRGALRELQKAGLATEAGEVWFAASAIDRAVETLAGLLGVEPAGFTVSAARQSLDSTRKYVVPLLAYLDSTGVTRRVGDVRVAGPRMPSTMEAG